MLTEPTFSFTIPSIHDDILLSCRIYNPPHSVLDPVDSSLIWVPRGAVVAHPYAPLGGCYDDAVVLSAAAEILKQGFVVGTFNFRGAGTSKGRTSWQAKAEIDDYISFVGLLVHYIENLRTPKSRPYGLGDPDQRLCSVPAAEELPSLPDAVGTRGMILILGGYSYGSLITTLLPTTDIILHRFESVTKGTAEAEIRLRAASLSTQWNKDAQLYREAQNVRRSESLRSSTRTMAVAVGGDESKLGSQRPSYESRRSFDAVRKSMERSRKKLRLRQHSSETLENDLLEKSLAPANIDLPRTHYFLVSPLLSPISMLVMMFSSFRSESQTHCEGKLLTHPALAVYGDNDFFTSQRKLRRWAEDLAAKPKSRFQFHEIAGAGHFWREEGVDAQMRGFLERWLQDLITGSQVA